LGADGNVGIGTATPSEKLTIVGSIGLREGALWQPVYPSDDGLVLYLPFSEGTGTIAHDKSPYGNDGTIYGATWTNGKYGKALSFDGVDDYVDTADIDLDYVTVSAWINVSTYQTNWRVIVSKGWISYSFGSVYLISIEDKGLSFGVRTSGGSTLSATTWVVPILNTWVHVVGTYDGSTVKLYVNGVLRASQPGSGVLNKNNYRWMIGRDPIPGQARYFNGLIDEVRIYNRALSEEEIRAHYLQGLQSHGYVMADYFKIINTSAQELLRVTPTGNVGIATTTPPYKLTVNGDLYVSATSTLGSATSTPVIFGGYVQSNIIPYFDNQYTLGLSNYRWANIFAATGTFGGTITIGTNTIQGSATTTLFTTGNANQLVLGVNGNVGIGEPLPSQKLTVSGGILATGNLTIQGLTNLATTTISTQLSVPLITSPSVLTISPSGNATTTITGPVILASQTGNVGIGTTAPSQRLTVAGNIGIQAGANAFVGTLDNYALSLRTNNTDRIFITNTGNVGIGTTGPSEKLTVIGNIRHTGSIIGGTTYSFTWMRMPSEDPNGNMLALGAGGTTILGSGESADAVAPNFNATDEVLILSSDSAIRFITNLQNGWSSRVDAMTITFSGNVGIGTTGPSEKLTVIGNIRHTGSIIGGTTYSFTWMRMPSEDPNGNMLALGAGGTTILGSGESADAVAPNFNATDEVLILSSDSAIRFITNLQNGWSSRVDAMTITFSGNVGIGTTSPSQKLTVAGNIGIQAGANAFIGTLDNYALSLRTNNADRVFITNTGNVGIGTTVPSEKLHISGGGILLDNNYALKWKDSTGNIKNVLWMDSSNAVYLRGSDSNNLILQNGSYWDVIIGGLNPTDARIVVEGGAGHGGTADAGEILFQTTNAAGSGLVTRLFIDAYADSGLGQIISYEPLTVQRSAYLATVSGNVGIGTTAPSSRLTIAAGATNGEFAIGNFNAKVVDDMEDVTDWSSSDGTYTPISLESTNVKVGNYALKISTTVSNSNGDTVTKTISNENWSSYGKLGFWIKASYTTTSTDATTSQIISIQFHDTGGNTQTHAITIQEFDQWQYEEWDISGVASGDKDVVDWIRFRIDNDYGSPVFYIDQIRLYSSTERTGEIFVDKSGSLVIMGRNTTEIYAPNSSSGQLPGLKVGPAVTEVNQPLSVNVGGDVGLSYDLVFLNTGLSSITSEGGLQILAGAPYRIANLTLGTQYNPGARDSGTSSGSNTATTLNDTSKSWATSTWVGGAVRITAGTGAGQVRAICANTPTQITVCDPWTTIPDTTSKYEIIGMPTGGDVIVDIGGANFASGGFKIFGADEGGAVFRVSPTGDVEIGSSGGWGEGKLIVKGGIILRGGNLQANKLSAPTGLNSTTQNSGGSLSGAVATYYYKVTAINDDGTETTPSATRAQSLTPLSAPTPSLTVNTTGTTYYAYRVAVYTSNGTSTPSTAVTTDIGADPPNNTISWSAVSGASGYILYRQKATTTADWEWIDVGTATSYNDTSGTWPATTTLPTVNNARTNTNIITLSWNVVPGAKGYKVYRGTDDVWGNADDRLVDNGVIFTNQVVDDGVGDSSGQVSPPTTNTTGGDLTIQGYITMANSTYQTLVTRVKAGPPTEADANGALVVDSADGRFYFRYGDTWHYVAQTAGFEIPANEIYDPITGQLISEGDFVLGWINEIKSDSARHGLWVRFDTVKDKIFSEFKEKIKNEFKFSIDDSGYLVVEKIKAKEIKAEKICLDDICITKEELRQLLESRNKEVGSMNGGESGGTDQESIINNSIPTESTPTAPTTESPSSTNETNL
jgi:hypothetical protein